MVKHLLTKFFILFGTVALHAQALPKEAPRSANEDVTPRQRNLIAASLLGQVGVFRENKGQMKPEIRYSSITPNQALFLMKDRLVFGDVEMISRQHSGSIDDFLKNPKLRPQDLAPAPRVKYTTWTLHFVNSKKETWLTAEDPSESYTNYLSSSDQSKNASFVYDFKKVTYHELYKNTDLVYYSHEDKLKYDFIVRPGGNLSDIRLQYEGIEKLYISHDGRLHILTPRGEKVEERPVSYQVINGQRISVNVSYRMIGETGFGFRVHGNYNPAYPLIIDPLSLNWSTYFGNVSSTDYLYTNGTSVDSLGFSYITGSTYNFWNTNTTFPTTPGAYDTIADGYYDAFVTKMNAQGTALVFSTFIGGGGYDWGIDITTNKLNAVFITGITYPFMSNPFPNTVNYTTVGSDWDIYAAQISPNGDRLVYSVLVGGAQWEYATTITVSGSNELYVAGYTMSGDFYTSPTAYRKTPNGNSDMFLIRINSTGTFITYSTFFGGATSSIGWWGNSETPSEIEIGLGNVIYLLGTTTSSDLPTTSNAYQSSYQGAEDMFLLKLNPFTIPANQISYCSYIGTTGKDFGMTFEMPKNGEFYIAGATNSSSFPGKINNYNGGTYDALVFRFDINKTGSNQMIGSRYIGGSSEEIIRCMRMNRFGNLYVTGGTKSSNFPVTNSGYDTTHNGDFDAFLMKLNRTIDTILLSSYFGGSGNDYSVYAVEYYYYSWFGRPSLGLSTADCIDKLTLGIPTNSTDFPTTAGAYQTERNSTWSWQMNTALVSFRDTLGNFAIIDLGPDTAFCKGFTYVVDAGNGGKDFKWRWNVNDGDTFQVKTITTAGTYFVDIFNTCSFRRDSLVIKHKDPEVNIPDPPLICGDFAMTLTAGAVNPTQTTYLWSTGATTRQIGINKPGDYWVIATNYCSSDTDTVIVRRKYLPAKPFQPRKDTIICDGGTAYLDALEPGGKFYWYAGSLNSTPIDSGAILGVNTAGKYLIKVSNECGPTVDSVNVITMNKPVLPMKNDTSICGSSVLFPVSAYNAQNKSPRYRWNGSNVDTLSFLIVNEFKFYTLEVKNFCGSHLDSFWVWKDSSPVFSLGPDKQFCDSVSTTINASFKGAKKYMWSTGDSTGVTYFNKPGTYWLDITNKCGTGRDSIAFSFVKLPVVNLGEDTLFCDAVNQFLDAGPDGDKYQWNTKPEDTLQTLTVLQPGIYSVKVSNLCGDVVDSIFVDVSTIPQVNLGQDTVYCNGFSRMMDASFPYSSYQWSTGATANSITINAPGKYKVTVKNQCGEVSDSINIIQKFTPVVNLGPDTAYCGRMNRTLNAHYPEASYIWNTGQAWDTMATLKVNKAGIYAVEVKHYCGNVTDSINLVINPFPSLNLGRDTSLCEGVDITLDAGADAQNILWLPSGNNSRYEQIKQYGTYVATVENEFGCFKTDTLRLMTLCPPRIFVPNAFTPNSHATVTNEVFIPSYYYVDAAEITIYNRWGEKVFHSTDMTKGWDGTLNGAKCPEGLYYYQITAKGYNAEQNISGNVLLIR